MPDEEKPSLIDRLIQGILQQALGGVRKTAERLARRIVKLIALALAGVAIAILGLTFTAIGLVKLLSNLVPSWLAWIWIGVVLILVGIVCLQQARFK